MICDYCEKRDAYEETESGKMICPKCSERQESFVIEGYSDMSLVTEDFSPFLGGQT